MADKKMRLPNGYGSVTKLSGRRRKPYVARVTLGWDVDQQEETVKQRRVTLGTYKTKAEALEALSEYRANPYDIQDANITLNQLYERWSAEYFATIEPSGTRSVSAAWKYCHVLYSMPVKDVRARHIKGIMEDAYIVREKGKDAGQKVMASPETKKRIKSIFNMLLDYAVEYEIIDRNYSRTFDISDDIIREAKERETPHIIFNREEMAALWDALWKVDYVDWILIHCYSGWRPQELSRILLSDIDLDAGTIKGGMKTEAGRGRIVPIHPRIRDLIIRNMERAESYGSDHLFNDPFNCRSGNHIHLTYDKYRHRFDRTMELLGFPEGHRAHDPRKTFVTMAKRAEMDEYAIKLIIGHHIEDLTERVYTQRDVEWLKEEIRKIP